MPIIAGPKRCPIKAFVPIVTVAPLGSAVLSASYNKDASFGPR